MRSGAFGNNGTTYLMASVKEAGTVSFWWKAQCETLANSGEWQYPTNSLHRFFKVTVEMQ